MYQISLHLFGLRGVNAMTSGILPYSFYIYLRVSEINPDEARCQCTPFPLSKIVRNFGVYVFLQMWSSEPHEMYIIFPYWVLTYFPCQCTMYYMVGCRCLKFWNGPWFPVILKCIERILPRFLLEYPRFHRYPLDAGDNLMSRDVESEIELNWMMDLWIDIICHAFPDGLPSRFSHSACHLFRRTALHSAPIVGRLSWGTNERTMQPWRIPPTHFSFCFSPWRLEGTPSVWCRVGFCWWARWSGVNYFS